MKRTVSTVVALLGVVTLGGCGARDDSPARAVRDATTPIAPPAQGRPLTSGELVAQVGNLFRRQLYALAVMSQPGEEAGDVGQHLTTGAVRRVTCSPPAGAARTREPWTCAVRWRTVAARADLTRYRVALTAHGCLVATAQPKLPEIYDATIRTYSEHPLNALQSLRSGC